MKRIFFIISFFFLTSAFLFPADMIRAASRTDELRPVKTTGKPLAPHFTVHVILTPNAAQRLEKSDETLVVFGTISGKQRPGVPPRYIDTATGEIFLVDLLQEKSKETTFAFDEIRLDKERLALVETEDYTLLINVVSGRRSSEFNLLACSPYLDSLRAVQGRTLDIECQLIGEDAFQPPRSRIR